MKILILGSKGMLAQDLIKVFYKDKPILQDKEDLDITEKNIVEQKIGYLRPDLIINAAAYTDVNKAETEKELAFQINSEGVGYLVNIAKKLGAILIHFSTDYVFDGNKKEGYKEDDIPKNPPSIYGKSKLEGEKKILSERELKYYLVRISWLFGPSTTRSYKNFVETILKNAKIKEELKVVNDQFGKPTYTLDVAYKIKELVENKKPFGIYHLVNEPPASWYEFAREIIRIAGLKTKIVSCTTKEFSTPAKRPKYSILLNTKTSPIRPWREALKEYLKGNI